MEVKNLGNIKHVVKDRNAGVELGHATNAGVGLGLVELEVEARL